MKLSRLLFWIAIASILYFGGRYLIVRLILTKNQVRYDPAIIHPASL